jgi:hypothetical protein
MLKRTNPIIDIVYAMYGTCGEKKNHLSFENSDYFH